MKKAILIICLSALLCGCMQSVKNDPPAATTPAVTTEPAPEEPATTAVHEHTPVVDAAIAPTCAKQGWTEGSHCLTCGEVLKKQTALAPAGHKTDFTPKIEPTCTKEGQGEGTACTVCGLQIIAPPVIPKAAHDYLFGKCKVCGTTEIDYSDLRLYLSGLGYAFFETQEHGEGMRKLYDEMMEELSKFHASETENAIRYTKSDLVGEVYRVAVFDFASYGLTLEEAQTVYTVFRMDNPIFYWMSYWLYWTDRSIAITTTADYANAADRIKYNAQIYAGIKEYAEAAAGETSAYEVALTYYEEIAKRAEYAYNDKNEAEDALWAHSIIGTFTHGKFVCEGYGKLFQILLNLSGIENSYISGDAGGSHFWNTAKMDDGKWYWFDVTWGDGDSISYKYFCALDENMSTHTPTDPNTLGMYFNGPIPECSDAPFGQDDIFEIGEYVLIDGREYVRNSKHTVKGTVSAAEFPPVIEHLGKKYKVTK